MASGTSICPACDYIIDDSFLAGADEAPPDDESRVETPPARPVRTGARGASARPSARSSASARPRVPPSSTRAIPEEDAGDATRIKSREELLRNAPQQRGAAGGVRAAPRPRPAAPRARPAPAPRRQEMESDKVDLGYEPPRGTTGTGNIAAPEELVEDFREFVSLLGLSDKVAFGSAALVVLSAFIPWKETTAEGEILGLMSLGLLAVLSAGGLMGTIALRVRRVMPSLDALIPWLVQLGLAIFTLLWCIIFMKLSSDITELPSPIMGNARIFNSTPTYGVYLGLLGALGSLVGTLMGLKEKPT